MLLVAPEIEVERGVPIPTWFGVGGSAARLARVRCLDDLPRCLSLDPGFGVLGDGANLLVADEGVGALVVSLDAFRGFEFDAGKRRLRAGGGASLQRIVAEAARLGLAGLEGLGGIPASVGGAVRMNAGGRFGDIAGSLARARVFERASGHVRTRERHEMGFGYRTSAIGDGVVVEAEFLLEADEAWRVRERLKAVMAYKKESQPLGERSAGCCFRNPTLAHPIEGIGEAGSRVSAGLLIDRAGCKGLRVRSASVSERHANFLVADAGGRANDVIELMREVERRVLDRFGVRLEREVVVWGEREGGR